jgi:hypothetical protein
MSWAASAYVKTLCRGAHGEPLTRAEKLLLMVMADYYSDEEGAAWPSATTLAREALLTRESVWRCIRRLTEKGVLAVEEQRSTRGAFVANRYRFVGLSINKGPSIRGDTRASNAGILGLVTPEVLPSIPPVTRASIPGDTKNLHREPPVEPPKRERGADAPAPPPAVAAKPRGNPKVAAVVDALRAEGMTGTITPRDAKAIRETEHDPHEVAALYRAIFEGEYGDPWMHTKLSVALCLEYLPGWRSYRAGHQAPARQNGRPPQKKSVAATALEGISDALGIGRDDLEGAIARGAAGAGGGGAPRRAVRPGAVEQELPRQLPG